MNPVVSQKPLDWRVLAGVAVLFALAPLVFDDFFVSVILTKALWLGVAAASLVFLSAYGGMGSLGGAAIGALALGMVDAYADVYLIFGDTDLTNYSILLTFALLVGVLAVRPLGLFGRPA